MIQKHKTHGPESLSLSEHTEVIRARRQRTVPTIQAEKVQLPERGTSLEVIGTSGYCERRLRHEKLMGYQE